MPFLPQMLPPQRPSLPPYSPFCFVFITLLLPGITIIYVFVSVYQKSSIMRRVFLACSLQYARCLTPRLVYVRNKLSPLLRERMHLELPPLPLQGGNFKQLSGACQSSGLITRLIRFLAVRHAWQEAANPHQLSQANVFWSRKKILVGRDSGGRT